jgi:hypothetical protein
VIGKVSYQVEPLPQPPPGRALICCSQPRDLALDPKRAVEATGFRRTPDRPMPPARTGEPAHLAGELAGLNPESGSSAAARREQLARHLRGYPSGGSSVCAEMLAGPSWLASRAG